MNIPIIILACASSIFTLLTGVITACAALGGASIGGIIAYKLKKSELRHSLLIQKIAKREELYSNFISECSLLGLMPIWEQQIEFKDLSRIDILLTQMRLSGGAKVVAHATKAHGDMFNFVRDQLKGIATNKMPESILLLIATCREELDELRGELLNTAN